MYYDYDDAPFKYREIELSKRCIGVCVGIWGDVCVCDTILYHTRMIYTYTDRRSARRFP